MKNRVTFSHHRPSILDKENHIHYIDQKKSETLYIALAQKSNFRTCKEQHSFNMTLALGAKQI